MRIRVTDNFGNLLDTVEDVTVEELAAELGILSQVVVGPNPDMEVSDDTTGN